MPSLESIKNDKQRMAVEYSIPKWIIEHWITHYGVETTRKMASSFLIKLRVQYVNTSKNKVEDVVSSLQSEGYEVEVDELIPYCLHLKGHPIIESSNFKNGNISIQDKSSMFVGYLMGVEENDVILDACSAPGGKACHIAELLAPSGHVDARYP